MKFPLSASVKDGSISIPVKVHEVKGDLARIVDSAGRESWTNIARLSCATLAKARNAARRAAEAETPRFF